MWEREEGGRGERSWQVWCLCEATGGTDLERSHLSR